jgi:hypothetical protein
MLHLLSQLFLQKFFKRAYVPRGTTENKLNDHLKMFHVEHLLYTTMLYTLVNNPWYCRLLTIARMYTFVSGARYAGVHAAGMNSIMIPSGGVTWMRI